MLGSYQDQTTAALVPKMGLEETRRTAFEDYGQNARYPHPGGMIEDPDGEMVLIYDEDAGVSRSARCPGALVVGAACRLIVPGSAFCCARMPAPAGSPPRPNGSA
jgi:hypothetical protein